jgi:hypothetical protein
MRRLFWTAVDELTSLPFMLAMLAEYGLTGRETFARRVRCRLLRRVFRARGVPDQGGCYCGRHSPPWP